MSQQLNCARNSISCIDRICMVCSGNSETWLAWPCSGISLQAQSHPKCCVILSMFFGFSIASDSAYAVHYSLVEVVMVEVASFNTKWMGRLVQKKYLGRIYVLYDNYTCRFHVKIIKRETVNEVIVPVQGLFKVHGWESVEETRTDIALPPALCYFTSIYTFRRNSVLLLSSYILGFLHSPCG